MQEKEAALTYYKEYFEEAGTEKEEEVIQELVSPSKIASQVMANYMEKEITNVAEEKKLKRSISTVWIVILAILASPIALPLAIAMIVLIIAMWIVILSFCISGIALIIGGAVSSILSIFTLIQDIFLGATVLGCGMLMTGLGLLITSAFFRLFSIYSSWITKKISKLLARKEQKNEK